MSDVLSLCGWGVWSDDNSTHLVEETRRVVRDWIYSWDSSPESYPGMYRGLSVRGAAGAPQRTMLWELARRLNGTDVPNIPQEVGDCFPAGTMVRMADGTEKPIETVLAGDEVVSAHGRTRRVTATFRKPYTGSLVTLRARGTQRSVTATPDHRFVGVTVSRGGRRAPEFGWSPIGDFEDTDRVLLTARLGDEIFDHVFDLSDDADASYEVGNEWIRARTISQKVRRLVRLNGDLGRLFGLYLAKGGVRSKEGRPVRVEFSFGRHEVMLVAECISLIEKVFGVVARAADLPSKPTVTLVRCDSSVVARFFSRLFPGNVYDKRVPAVCRRAEGHVKLAMLRGWMDGDGHTRLNEANGGHSFLVTGVSSSRGLRQDMFEVALSCGLKPSECIRKKASHQSVAAGTVNLYGENALAIYPECRDSAEAVGGRKPWKRRSDMTALGLAPRVKSIEWHEVANSEVYCLEVEEDHSFVANGYGVHNCVSWGMKHAIEFLQFAQIANGQRLDWTQVFSPYLWGMGRLAPDCGNNQLGRRDGSVGGWQAQAVMRYGTLAVDAALPTGEKVPAYSGSVARQWGNRPGPSQPWVDLGKQHIVKSAALVTTYLDVQNALTNGYPVTIASNVGFTMNPQGDGFHHRWGWWGHQMCVIGFDPGDDKVPEHYCVMNSWGDVHGHFNDFRTGEQWPVGCLRVSRASLEKILAEQDSYACSGIDGFPAQPIPRPAFDPW